MQQELIEMLEEIIQYVEVWNAHDQSVLDKAEALIEKAKNSAKEPAVPQGWTDATPAPAPAQEVGLTEDEIISIKKASKAKDPAKPWGDSIAFAEDIIAALRAKENKL